MESSDKLSQSFKTAPNGDNNVQHLRSEVEYRTKLQEISNQIYAAFNLDEILIDLIFDAVGQEPPFEIVGIESLVTSLTWG